MDVKLQEYKKLIWNNLKFEKWTKEYLISLTPQTNDHSWNEALSAAQKWVSSNDIKESIKQNSKTNSNNREQPILDKKVAEYEMKQKQLLICEIKAQKNLKKSMVSKLPHLKLDDLENLLRMLIASTEEIEPGGTRYNNMQHRLESAKDSTKWHSRADKYRRKR